MRVLFLARRFYPDIGGVEKHVEELSKLLIKQGHSVTVVTESQGKESSIDEINIVRVGKLPDSWFKKFYIWKWFWLNRSLIKEADVVHAHDVFYWYLPFKLLFLNKKCFVTFHGYENYPISQKARVVRKISEKMANGNIIVGDFIKKWYGTKPNFVIYGAVNVPPKTSAKSDLNSAVFFGRLDAQTGVLEYGKAVDLIRKKNHKFKFQIIGDGEYKNRLKRFKPIGFKKDIQKYLDRNNFVFVSRYLSILEALVNKNLVFAIYDNPLKKDYLEMTPFSKFIIKSSSPEGLARKVEYYLDNPKQADKLIEGGFNWAKKQTWENVLSVYLRLWKVK
jgi:glycosyltransferase involved in cell wall biosynthesis